MKARPILTGFAILLLGMLASAAYSVESGKAVGIWLFNEGEGDVAGDSSGNGFHGQILADVRWTEGTSGGALEFPGHGEANYVRIPHEATLDLVEYSITAWLKLLPTEVIPTENAWQLLLGKWQPHDVRNYGFMARKDTGVILAQFTSGGARQYETVVGKTNLADEEWHHITCTYDGSFLRLYVDGAMEAEITTPEPDINTGDLTIGAALGGAYPTKGAIDDVGLFNTALKKSEIQEIMTHGLWDALDLAEVEKVVQAIEKAVEKAVENTVEETIEKAVEKAVSIALSSDHSPVIGEGHTIHDEGQVHEDGGLSFEIVHTGDVVRTLSGGIRKGTAYMGNVDFTLALETEKAGWWPGGTFFVYGLHNYSSRFATEELIGDLQTVSSLEAPEKNRLYEIWYEHSFLDGNFSVLAGQHDLNSEFDVTEYGGLFINSSFGIHPGLSANIPVSIFPQVGPAIRFKLTPGEEHESLLGIYDGDPGDPELGRQTWDFSSKEGALVIFEEAYHRVASAESSQLPGTYKLGLWYHSADFEDSQDSAELYDPNYGIYFVADQVILPEEEGREIGVFLQTGYAPKDRNTVDFYIGGGVHLAGIIPGRKDDTFGIAMAHASLGSDLISAENLKSSETTLEITYHFQATSWLAIQPDFQYVFNPGADPGLSNAAVGLVRLEVAFSK